MNYQEMLLRTMRKVPDSYRGYVNTSAIDRAEGAKQTQRDLNYQRLAQMRDENNARADLAQQRFDNSRSQFNQGYGFREGQLDSAKNNMLIANLLGGAGVGVNYLQGRNQAKANQALTSLLQEQAKFYNSLNQPVPLPEQRGRLYDHGGFMYGNRDMGFGG